MTRSTTGRYDRFPTISLPEGTEIVAGAAVWARLGAEAVRRADGRAPVLVVDAYPGADVPAVLAALEEALPGFQVVDVEARAGRSAEQLERMLARTLTQDRVFARMDHYDVEDFYDPDRVEALRQLLSAAPTPVALVGWGAAWVWPQADVVALADMARWEIQQRQRAGAPNWRAGNETEDPLGKFKRGYFVEWRAADRHKVVLFARADYVIDVNRPERAAMLTAEEFALALHHTARRPFRLVPFFDPGVWGGQWMKETFGLDDGEPNYAWCFDCVPEENSLLLTAGEAVMEVPAMDLVLCEPLALLGERTYARFGAEFPIRFDLLDTMGGENLSLQVHPSTDDIRRTFGMGYTQDESYYLLECSDDAVVYLGLKEPVDPDAVAAALRQAAGGGDPFPAERFVNAIPVRKHDHYSIPAGTVHCSGAGSVVLEISATPYVFTFKLWDWSRVGLDGRPRPVHLDHGLRNVVWSRDTAWVKTELAGGPELVAEHDGVREERTGLHELEFIEARRHWFEREAHHHTEGTVNVLNLVEGDEVEVVSPGGAFAPFTVRYAETFVVPAAVGPYLVRASADAVAPVFATIKASVRGTGTSTSTLLGPGRSGGPSISARAVGSRPSPGAPTGWGAPPAG